MSADDYLRAFLTDPTDVFHTVEDRQQVCQADPFDAMSVHAEAREVFENLLAQATGTPGPTSGRVLLLLGDSGTGKTHLIRAFRKLVHGGNAGFLGYMQMISASTNYPRYVLSNLIDSLDQPYNEPFDTRTSLVRIAGALASQAFELQLKELLQDDPALENEDIDDLIYSGADRLIQQERFADLDLDLLRAFLYLSRPDPAIKSRVLRYLRCEDLAESDRKRLGNIVPRADAGDPERMITQLGRLIAKVGERPMSLVFCLDQMEDTYLLELSEVPYRRAITTVRDLAERLPRSIFVVCCLANLYSQLKAGLSASLRDRLEHDPAPVTLKAGISVDQAKEIVGARLQHLYRDVTLEATRDPILYPFTSSFFERRRELTARTLLQECRNYRERCQKAGRLVDEGEDIIERCHPPDDDQAKAVQEWERRWNDFLAEDGEAPPEEEEELAELLSFALDGAVQELFPQSRLFRSSTDEGTVRAEICLKTGATEVLHIGLCNRTSKFGWLAKQIGYHAEKVEKDASKPILVLVRNDEFPRTPSVNKELAHALRARGRTVLIQDTDWRTMLAMKKFREFHRREPFFDRWNAGQYRHLSQIGPVRQILDLDRIDRFATESPREATPQSKSSSVRPPSQDTAPRRPVGSDAAPSGLIVGTTQGLLPKPVSLDPEELARHAAFLGGSGSGKTTLALSLIEQLLLRGVPALLIDRKGDLAGYARPDAWAAPLSDPALEQQRKRLSASVDVAFFTPGHPEGRPLSISVAPDGLKDLPPFDRDEAAANAAQALGDMLGYRTSGRDSSLRAVLIYALQVLASGYDKPITLDALVSLIDEEDASLVAAVGRLDTKLFKQLVQSLETMRATSAHLFASGGESLDVDLLLGTGSHVTPGRTRLSIISTKFLRDDAQIQFWVAQLLFSVLRWASCHPKNQVQAAILFDEADLYLPAMRQPATKAPMESLLKRGRSAGLSVFLATQSPGDLDYRCRDTIRSWFLGRVKEPTALAKLRPMLAESSVDDAKLAGQGPGEFHWSRDGSVTQLKARRSVLTTEQLPDTSLLNMARRTRNGQSPPR